VRPSHDTREQTIAELRRGFLAGRLGTDTFAHRLGDAFESPSREHLRGLTADRDLRSSNGTYVNGRLVTEAEVRAGDVVHLGGCRLRL
jgi:pSer/pThr/pTyr-binding forkhead associated (FHA) protein